MFTWHIGGNFWFFILHVFEMFGLFSISHSISLKLRTIAKHQIIKDVYKNKKPLKKIRRWFCPGLGMGDDNRLPPGQHVYPFTFTLPPNLPSSFEGGTGYVRYTIKGTIDKPWKFDHNTKRPFTVIALLDLNTQPNAAVSSFHRYLWVLNSPAVDLFAIKEPIL